MKKKILGIGVIWSVLTVMCLGIISTYNPDTSGVTEIQNAVFAVMILLFIPSIFVVAYYLKTKSVSKISYVILGLLYIWSFMVMVVLSVAEEWLIPIILLIIPNIGFIIWIKLKQDNSTITKNNNIQYESKIKAKRKDEELAKVLEAEAKRKDEEEEKLVKQKFGIRQTIRNFTPLKKDIIEYESKTQKIESDKIEDIQKGITDLIKSPESETLEFKSTLKWDIRENRSNPSLVLECVKTIAGFLNNRGGILIVGYDDDNDIIYGLEKDYPFTSKKQNYDGWQQYFINQINDKLGKTINHYFTIEPISYNGKTLAKIRVQPSPEPVFTKHDNTDGNFFARIHGQTEKFNPQETQKWISDHFKK